jgi:pimeloyl-ACP methyl ester carboxylesterase
MYARFPYLSDAQRDLDLVRRAAVLERRIVTAPDGRPLAAFVAGPADAPTVLLVNPLGSTCLFFVPLIEILARDHRVVTWETRGLPGWYPDDAPGDRAWAPEVHTADLAAVVGGTGGGVTSVISYCSGSHVAVHAIARGALAPARVALISPPIELRGDGPKTLYQKTMPPLLARIARGGPRTVALFRALLQHGAQVPPGAADHELHVLNNLPFTSDDRTYRYAALHAAWYGTPWRELLAQIAIPVAIFHGSADEIVHTDTARALAAALAGARLHVYEHHGHFAVATCDALIADAIRFATPGPGEAPPRDRTGSPLHA